MLEHKIFSIFLIKNLNFKISMRNSCLRDNNLDGVNLNYIFYRGVISIIELNASKTFCLLFEIESTLINYNYEKISSIHVFKAKLEI